MTDQFDDPIGPFTRRKLVKAGLGSAGLFAAGPLLAACGSSDSKSTTAATSTGELKGTGEVIIGAFDDGGLAPFKEKVIPIFEKETGIKVKYLVDDYDTFFEKAFNDGQSKAGQYDVYIMDDPWIPQYASAGILEDLGAQGVTMDSDVVPQFAGLSYWPPQEGPRVPGFQDKEPQLIAFPFVGDLQSLTYNTTAFKNGPPKTWDELVATGKQFKASGPNRYGYVFRGVAGNPIVTSWYPVFLSFGGQFFDDKWNPTFNSPEGKQAADFFVGTLKSLAPPGVVEFDSDQEGAAILGGEAASIIQYSGNAIKSDDPEQSKEVGKLDFAIVPKQVKSAAQIGIFISGVSTSAPNKDNAFVFAKWWLLKQSQLDLARAGSAPIRTSAFKDPQAQKNDRLLPTLLQQLQVGAEARPRTPDWSKIEQLIGVQLNKALQKGSGGGAALDTAASQVKDYLTKQGYYK